MSSQQQFRSVKLSRTLPELSREEIMKRLSEGGSNDIGIIFSLSQVLEHNIDITKSCTGFTIIDQSNGDADAKGGRESSEGSSTDSNDSAELGPDQRARKLEKGIMEMNEINASLKDLLQNMEKIA